MKTWEQMTIGEKLNLLWRQSYGIEDFKIKVGILIESIQRAK